MVTIYSKFSILPMSRRGSNTSHFRSDLKNIETCCKAISEKTNRIHMIFLLRKKRKSQNGDDRVDNRLNQVCVILCLYVDKIYE